MNNVKFKVGDKVVFCKSSLESGMIDAKEGEVFTVQVQDNSIVYLKEQSGGYHHTHFEHYVEKEKEMEKKFAKVGDKIRIIAEQDSEDLYKNGDVLEVTCTYRELDGVDVLLGDGDMFHVYHTEYEIVEDGKEDDFVFTEEHVGMEVWDIQQGCGKIYEFDADELYAVSVEFENGGDYTYTKDGRYLVHHKLRQLYFSEPKVTIEAERFPPKKKFVPTLNKGDEVIVKTHIDIDSLYTVEKETEDHVYFKEKAVIIHKSNIKSIYKIGEEIKFS